MFYSTVMKMAGDFYHKINSGGRFLNIQRKNLSVLNTSQQEAFFGRHQMLLTKYAEQEEPGNVCIR